MAIAYVTSGKTAVGAGTQTLNIDCGSGSNTVLFVVSMGSNIQSTTVTFDGNAMTDSGLSHTGSFGGGAYNCKLWYYLSPASGSKTISVGGASSNGIFASVYSGVNQSTPIEDTVAGVVAGTRTTQTETFSTSSDNSWLFQWCQTDGAATNSAGTSTTLRQTGNSASWCDSNAAKTPPGSYSIATNTTGGACNWAHIYGSIKLASSGTAYSATVSNTLTTSDQNSLTWAAILSKVETLGFSNVATRQTLFGLTPSNTVGLTDIVLLYNPGSYSESVVETFYLSDDVSIREKQVLSVTVAELLAMNSLATTSTPGLWSYKAKNTGGTWTFTPKQ